MAQAAPSSPSPSTITPVVSVVIPCLNEIHTIATCVTKALGAFSASGMHGEVIVADNGSSDGSSDAASRAGAIVVREPRRGYGSAYLAGFARAGGKYLVMGDGDDTYDFSEIPRFLAPLQAGTADFVIGDRLGGDIKPGAMSWSHRWIGNPILSGLLRLLFRTHVADSHCGMRAFTREAWDRMRLGATGMEFASEMVVAALRERLRIVELPIAYYPRVGESKLQGLSDAWRHTRFMLMFSPSYLFLLPGSILAAVGLLSMTALAFGPAALFGRRWDYHPLLFGAAFFILGFNLITFDLLAKSYAIAAGFHPRSARVGVLIRMFSVERGLLFGCVIFAAGAIVEVSVVAEWIKGGYGELMAVRQVVIGMAAMVVGLQTMFGSFLLGLMRIHRDR